MTVDVVLKCLQHLHLLALQFTEDAERMFNGRICTEGNIVLKFLVEEGIGTEDAECILRGDIEILICFEKLIEFCLKGDTVKRRAIFISVLDVCKY